MKKSFGKSVFVGLSILAVCAMFLALQPTPKMLRVGTFDSRAIAIAYARSDLFAPYMRSMGEKYEKAKAEKNEKAIKEFEAVGQIMHQQGFSIASVADILEKVKASSTIVRTASSGGKVVMKQRGRVAALVLGEPDREAAKARLAEALAGPGK